MDDIETFLSRILNLIQFNFINFKTFFGSRPVLRNSPIYFLLKQSSVIYFSVQLLNSQFLTQPCKPGFSPLGKCPISGEKSSGDEIVLS